MFNDYSRGAPGDAPYDAQILEMERAITDQWMAALYLEGDKIDGEDYAFGGWRLESRYRLFSNSTFLNPVLYVEYRRFAARSSVSARGYGATDTPASEAGSEIESRLILGQDAQRQTRRRLQLDR